MKRYTNGAFLFVAVFLLSLSVQAQTAPSPANSSERVLTEKLDSKLMQREMPYRVILPPNYNTSNEKTYYPSVYLLHGLTGHFDNWSEKTKLEEYSANHNFVIVMPEGDNGWYTDSVSSAKDKYESYIIQELIPEIEKKFRVDPKREKRVIAGLSMGGYGGLKFGLKYPEKFVLAGSFSGALRAAEWNEKNLTGGSSAFLDSINSIYGKGETENRTQNDLFGIVSAKTPEEIKSLPFIYLDCGTEDFLIAQSQDLAALLHKKKIPHEFRQLPGIHNWEFWDAQVLEFLDVAKKFTK